MTPQEIHSLKIGDVLEHTIAPFDFIQNYTFGKPAKKKNILIKYTVSDIVINDYGKTIVVKNVVGETHIEDSYSLRYDDWKLVSQQEQDEEII